MSVTTTTAPIRVVPWIGVGTTGSWNNVSEALHDSGLDYEVKTSIAYDKFHNPLPDTIVNYRTDTEEQVGVVSGRYGIVQNADAFSLLDPFCANGGVIEHAGMTQQGMCFMVMRMPSNAFRFHDNSFELYVCAMNSFNAKFPLALIITPVRVICQNMFRKLMKRGDAMLVIKHGRFATDRIMSAMGASIALTDYQVEFVDTLDRDLSLHRTHDDLDSFVERMLPFTPETPEHPRAKFTNERVEEQRREFVDSYYLAPDNARYVGTRLGILNAYYDWLTHHTPTRTSDGFEEIRLGNLMSGTAVNNRLILSA